MRAWPTSIQSRARAVRNSRAHSIGDVLFVAMSPSQLSCAVTPRSRGVAMRQHRDHVHARQSIWALSPIKSISRVAIAHTTSTYTTPRPTYIESSGGSSGIACRSPVSIARVKVACPYTPPYLFDGIDEVAAAKVVCQHLGGNRADEERHFMNMARAEIERDVARVATPPHPSASILRERGARVALLSEASIHGARVEHRHDVWRASVCQLPWAASALRLKSSLVRLQSCAAKQDAMGVSAHDNVTLACVVRITKTWTPHGLTRD